MGEEEQESHGRDAPERVESDRARGLWFGMGRWNHQLSPGRGVPPYTSAFQEPAMKLARGIAALAAAAPIAVLAQVVYPAPRVVTAPDYMPRELWANCSERQDVLAQRRADLERQRANLDRENEQLSRQGRRLADELRNLNARDAAAVDAYNARQSRYNQRVEDHNRRAADMNDAAASTNIDVQYLLNDCVPRGFVWRDRDWWERDAYYSDRYRLR
jgi:phage-related minor tail protein